MKKVIAIIISTLLILSTVCGCGNAKTDRSKLNVVCTSFSLYDFAKNITVGSDAVDLKLISTNGADMHSYQPTADDIINIQSADLLIFIGSSSEKWVNDAIKAAKSKNLSVLNSLDVISERILYIDSENEEDNHNHNDIDKHNNSKTADEHIWLSLKNAVIISESIKDKLCEIDTNNSELYNTNYQAYSKKLNELNEDYQQKFITASKDTLILADRFPFRYLLSDYSLNAFSLFEGCSAESDTTVDSILKLSKKIDELNINYVFIIDSTATKTAKAVIDNTKFKNQKIITLNSLQATTDEFLKSKNTYISVMKDNLELIFEALK